MFYIKTINKIKYENNILISKNRTLTQELKELKERTQNDWIANSNCYEKLVEQLKIQAKTIEQLKNKIIETTNQTEKNFVHIATIIKYICKKTNIELTKQTKNKKKGK